jgi:hypothetical protein
MNMVHVGALYAMLSGADMWVDQVAMVVDKDVITSSELECEIRLALVLREGARAADGVLEEKVYKELWNYVLNQHLVAQEVRKAGLMDLKPSDIEESMRLFQSRFSSETALHAFLKKHDITLGYVRDIFARDTANDRYIKKRVAARMVRTESNTSETQEALFHKAVREWLEELRLGADVKVLNQKGSLERLGL